MANDSSRVRTLSNEKAQSVVEARRRGLSRKLLAEDCGTIEVRAGWDPVTVDRACVTALDLLEKLTNEGAKIDAFNFDRVACALIHREMQLPPKVAASDGFWRWLAVERLHRVVENRRNLRSDVASLENYGIGTRDIGKNRLGALWLRADMLYDADARDPYHLANRFLHMDFIMSGIIRHRYGWCRNLAHALVRFQYRKPESTDVYLHSTDPSGIRRLYKRLRHLHSIYAFEFMSDRELDQVLKQHSQDLVRAQ